MIESTDILFVAWQDAVDFRYYPVARLIRQRESGWPAYEFSYIHGAQTAQATGFRPFMAFPDLDRVYSSDELFPFFANRLLSRTRADYADYVRRLGLDPASPDEFAILARSGGGRATDPIELFPFPFLGPDIGYFTYFCVHSLRHLDPLAQVRAAAMQPGEKLTVMLDCQNPVDPKAIALRTEDRIIVGYLPGYLLEDAWKLLPACLPITVRVAQVNPPPAPLSQRVLCRLEACWPDGFVPFSSQTYQPIAASAFGVDSGVVAPTELLAP